MGSIEKAPQNQPEKGHLGESASFENNVAVMIGINNYQNGIPSLKTPIADASKLAETLINYNYQFVVHNSDNLPPVDHAINENVTADQIKFLFRDHLPKFVGPKTRLVVYFAGHGTRETLEDGTEMGYLVPVDGRGEKLGNFIDMVSFNEWLTALPCHHKLVILDCCNAGAFRWMDNGKRTRSWINRQQIYREQYESYLKHPVYQVLTSAGQKEKALDNAQPFGIRGMTDGHSPFALALIKALGTDSKDATLDGLRKDGIFLASELNVYLKNSVKLFAQELFHHEQTPQFFSLSKNDLGEFMFESPYFNPDQLNSRGSRNVYKGFDAYEEADSPFFFGRQEEVDQLRILVEEKSLRQKTGQLFVVHGSPRVGKRSFVQAGLIPALRNKMKIDWTIVSLPDGDLVHCDGAFRTFSALF